MTDPAAGTANETGTITVERHGARIPALGLGTWELRGATAQRMVEAALGMGYRHLDTAAVYGNEREVGAGLRASGLPREAVWLTTKISPDRFATLLQAAEERVSLLGTVPDLLLLHWPNPRVPLAATLAALDEARRRGLARHIGVSNFTTALIEEATRHAAAPLLCDQVEYHPYLAQRAVLRACRAKGMVVTAYCPIARGRVMAEPLLQEIGRRHRKSAGQVALRWLVQQEGVCAIPRTSSEANAAANLAIFDFTLGEEEMAAIHGLAEPGSRICDYPGLSPVWDAN